MEDTPDTNGERLTSFDFEHKAFGLPNAHFRLTPSTREPVFYVDLGDIHGAIPLSSLAATLGIKDDDDSRDARLLRTVTDSLRYVNIIRPGDAIPREILDGSASWTVSDKHRRIAEGKIMTSILSLLAGKRGEAVDNAQLQAMAQSDTGKRVIQDAAEDLAKMVGLPVEKKAEILTRIEVLTNECAFLEALREHFKQVTDLRGKLNAYTAVLARDRTAVEEVRRIEDLLRTPLAQIQNMFDEVDAYSGEALNALRQFDNVVALLRRHRDELHFQSLDWADTLALWQKAGRDPRNYTDPIRALYRFLANRYLHEQVWTRRS